MTDNTFELDNGVSVQKNDSKTLLVKKPDGTTCIVTQTEIVRLVDTNVRMLQQ